MVVFGVLFINEVRYLLLEMSCYDGKMEGIYRRQAL